MGLGQATLAVRVGNHISCPSRQQLWCSGPGQAGGLWEQVGAMPASYYDSGNGLLGACRTWEGRWLARFSSRKLQWYSPPPRHFLTRGIWVLGQCSTTESPPWKARRLSVKSPGPLVWLSGLPLRVPLWPLYGRMIVIGSCYGVLCQTRDYTLDSCSHGQPNQHACVAVAYAQTWQADVGSKRWTAPQRASVSLCARVPFPRFVS